MAPSRRDSACRQGRKWLDRGFDFGRIAINIAGPQLQRGNLLNEVQLALDSSGLPTHHLEREVTEGFIMQQAESAISQLQALRDRLGKPLIVRSAYRSPAHNRAVGGAPRSKHMDGAAFDIAMTNHDPVAFEAAARAVGFLGFGFYPRSGFIHVDLDEGPLGPDTLVRRIAR